jgi:hypothetical protein
MPHRRPHRATLLATAVLAAIAPATLPAATLNVTWDGATADWTDSIHWGLASGYPDNNLSPGTDYNVSLSGGTIGLNVSTTIDQLSVNAGNSRTLSGTETLTVTQGLLISSDSELPSSTLALDASLVAASTAHSTINGSLELTDRASFSNSGTLTLAAGTIRDQRNTGQFTNTGTLISTQQSEIFALNFINKGNIDIQSGTLLLDAFALDGNSGAQSTGSVTVEAGANLEVVQYPFSASTITGAGNVIDLWNLTVTLTYSPQGNTTVGGTLTLGGTTSAFMAGGLSLQQNGAILSAQSLAYAGSNTWDGFFIGTSATTKLTLQSGGQLSYDPSLGFATAELDGSSSIADATTLTLSDQASFINAGTLTVGYGLIQGVASRYGHAGVSSFINRGQLIVNDTGSGFAISDQSTNTLTFLNTGTITINAGHFKIDALDAGSTGTINIVDGQLLLGSGRSFTFGTDGAPTLTGLGGVLAVGATVTLPADLTFAGSFGAGTINIIGPRSPGARLPFVAALAPETLNIYSDVSFTGNMNLSGTTSIASGTTAQFLGVGAPFLANLIIDGTAIFTHTPTVSGTVTLAGALAGGTLPGLHGGTLSTSAISTAVLQMAGAWSQNTGATVTLSNGASLTNSGTLTAAPGAIVLNDTASFTNTGTLTVNAASGTFIIQSGSPSASFSNTGLISLSAGTLTLSPSAGATVSGSIQSNSSTALQIGSNLTLAGTIAGSVTVLVPASSTLTFGNNFNFATLLRPILSGAGAILIPTGNTLTLASDSPFSGAYTVNGALIIAAPRNSAKPTFLVTSPFALAAGASFSSSRPVQFSYVGSLDISTLAGTYSAFSTSISNHIIWATAPFSTGDLTLTNGANLIADNTTFTVTGKIFMTNATLISNSPITLSAGATFAEPSPDGSTHDIFDVPATLPAGQSATATASLLMNASIFTNDGTFSISSPAGQSRSITGTDTFNNSAAFITDGSISISTITFNNTGTLTVNSGAATLAPKVGSLLAGAIIVKPNASITISNATVHPSSLQIAGTLTLATSATLDPSSTLQNSGLIALTGGALTLAAPQDPATTGDFDVAATAALEFAADYNFSSPTGPTLTGTGTIIIDPGVLLTLPVDTAFAGTIEINGALMLAAARNPANADAFPAFTVISSPVPEPATASLLALAPPLLLRRPRSSRHHARPIAQL